MSNKFFDIITKKFVHKRINVRRYFATLKVMASEMLLKLTGSLKKTSFTSAKMAAETTLCVS